MSDISRDTIHPSAVGHNTQVDTSATGATTGTPNAQTTTSSTSPGSDYPEQRHAGAVGYGPNYHQGPTFTEKVSGLKEEVKGKVTRKPDVVQHGRDMRTGELKRKEREQDLNTDPFAKPEEKKEQKEQMHQEKFDKEQAANV